MSNRDDDSGCLLVVIAIFLFLILLELASIGSFLKDNIGNNNQTEIQTTQETENE